MQDGQIEGRLCWEDVFNDLVVLYQLVMLAAILVGLQPFKTTVALLAYFNDRISDLRRVPAQEIAGINCIRQQNDARIKAAGG